MRAQPGVYDEMAAGIFALVVFLCDDLLRLKHPENTTNSTRFFQMASKLPLELQMLLCHRIVSSGQDTISRGSSERAFLTLAQTLAKLKF